MIMIEDVQLYVAAYCDSFKIAETIQLPLGITENLQCGQFKYCLIKYYSK